MAAVVNTTKTYTATITAGATTPIYAWSIDGGGTVQGLATGSTFQVLWTTVGTWTVTCTVSNGCPSTVTQTFSVPVTAECVSIQSVSIAES